MRRTHGSARAMCQANVVSVGGVTEPSERSWRRRNPGQTASIPIDPCTASMESPNSSPSDAGDRHYMHAVHEPRQNRPDAELMPLAAQLWIRCAHATAGGPNRTGV